MGIRLASGVSRWVIAAVLTGVSTSAAAVDVKLTSNKDFIQVKHEGKMVKVERNQDLNHHVDAFWAKTSRKCPPFCIQPDTPAEGVTHVGEYEVIEFMTEKVNPGSGVMIDARVPSWHKKGTIPGSVNIPFTVFDKLPTDPELGKALTYLGATRREGVGSFMRGVEKQMAKMGIGDNEYLTGYWDFTNAKDVLLWCNGPWCGQSPRAIHGLVKVGYPTEKIFYYRGGMQSWEMLGLTVLIPEGEGMFANAGGGGE